MHARKQGRKVPRKQAKKKARKQELESKVHVERRINKLRTCMFFWFLFFFSVLTAKVQHSDSADFKDKLGQLMSMGFDEARTVACLCVLVCAHTCTRTHNHVLVHTHMHAGVPHTLAKIAICYCILHFGY